MSFFIPLNVYEEDIIQDAEQHTKELQIEEALKVYQSALEYQKNHQVADAHREYDRLFAIDALKLTFETGLPPSAVKLKYLALKNYALLLLYELEQNSSELTRDSLVDKIGTILDWISDALEYNDSDTSFLRLIYEISIPLGFTRIARLALESIVYADSRVVPADEEFITNNGRVSPEDARSLIQLKDLLLQLSDTQSFSKTKIFTILKDASLPEWLQKTVHTYSWLTEKHPEIVDNLSNLVSLETNERELEVSLPTTEWSSILSVLYETSLSLVKGRKKWIQDDPYAFSTHPVSKIKFILPHGHDMLLRETPETSPDEAAAETKPLSATLSDTTMTDTSTTVDASSHDCKSNGNLNGTPLNNNNTKTDEAVSALKKKKRRAVDTSETVTPSRTSKRIKTKSDENLETSPFSTDEPFFENLNSFIAPLDISFKPILRGNGSPSGDGADGGTDHDQYIFDFKNILESWDDEQAELMMANELTTHSDTNDMGRKSVESSASDDFSESQASPEAMSNSSIMQMLNFAAMGNSVEVKHPTSIHSSLAVKFINLINNTQCSLQFSRFRALTVLLRVPLTGSGSSDLDKLLSHKYTPTLKLSILLEHWPTDLIEMLTKSLDHFEDHMFTLARSSLTSQNTDLTAYWLGVAEVIHELFVEKYLDISKNIKTADTKTAKELSISLSSFGERVQRWNRLVHDLISVAPLLDDPEELKLVELRSAWVNVFYLQQSGATTDYTFERYNYVSALLSQNCPDRSIDFLNYSNIPVLSKESIVAQISKLQAVSIFSKIFTEAESDEEALEERGFLLESILMPDTKDERLPEHDAIAQFMAFSSNEFRLQLWYKLLDVYNEKGEPSKALDGFLRIFNSHVSELTSDSYDSNTEAQKSALILRTLHICSNVVTDMLKIIMEDESVLKSLSTTRIRETLDSCISLIRMIYVFIGVLDCITNNVIQAPSHLSWEKLVVSIQELTGKSWCFFYYIFRTGLPDADKHPDILNDILSVVHESIGTRGFCGICDGILLKLSLKEFVRMDWEESEADLLQCLHCLYGLGLGNEHFNPTDHHCTPVEMPKSVPANMSKFITRMIMRKAKNISQSVLKTEVKTALDMLHEVIGPPDRSVFPFEENAVTVESFLSKPISLKMIANGLRGRLNLNFIDTNNENARAGKAGLYYLYAQSEYCLFKVRQKSIKGLIDDLEDCVDNLFADLMCNTNRFESWVTLAHVLDALATDDLTWNADKLNNEKDLRKIAANQRRAILCCTMAVNIHVQNLHAGETEKMKNMHYEQLLSSLWTTLARLLYNAARSPMDMAAYNDIPTRVFCGDDGIYTKKMVSPMKQETVLTLVKKLLLHAITQNPTEWYNYYLLAKVSRNLSDNPESVLKCLKDALKYAPDKSTNHSEAAIEPHYKLVVFAHKYFRDKLINVEEAQNWIESTVFYESGKLQGPMGDLDEATTRFYSNCLATLGKIRGVDKKKWHHRPTYLTAVIYDQIFGQKAKAKAEISTFLTLKTSQKNPVMIWKPDLERPGEHFKYVYQYLMYFVDLAKDCGDVSSLMIIARKLRRFSSGMINHHRAWEHLCLSAALTVKSKLQIESRYTDVIVTLVYDEFDNYSNKLLAAVENDKVIPELMGWLNLAQEFRKLNNGAGSTAALDDVFISIYLKIYNELVPKLLDGSAVSAVINTTPRDIMSVQSLVSQPSTPPAMTLESDEVSPSSKVQSPGSKADGGAHKVRVTKREIINRALALLRAVPESIRLKMEPVITESKTSNGSRSKTSDGASTPLREVSVPPNGSGPDTDKDTDTPDVEMSNG